MAARVDLTNKRHGRLVAIRPVGKDVYNHILWECLCDCGNVVQVTTSNFNNTTFSCGCQNNENIRTHNLSDSRIYQCWADMKTRCDNPENEFYSYYGGRGISYCEKWKTFEGFYEDMSPTYNDSLTLERTDPDDNYCKESCVWATRSVQGHTRRKLKGCSSKYKGVGLERKTGKWYSRIRICGNLTHLGVFKDELDAAVVYDNRSEQVYGDRPNKT